MRLALAVLLLLTPATPAAAWSDLGPARGEVVADGERFAVQPLSDRQLIVHDDRRPPRSIDVGPQCWFTVLVGSGRALLTCSDRPSYGTTRPVVLDLETFATQLVTPAPFPELFPMGVHPAGVGRRWVQLNVSGYHWDLRRYVRLTDGAIRKVDSLRADADFDAVNVRRPLCTPLRRPHNPQDNGIDVSPPGGAVAWIGRWMVYRRGFSHVEGSQRPSEIDAWRCGRRRPVRISVCPSMRYGCGEPAVGRRLVAWVDGPHVRAATLGPLRRMRLRKSNAQQSVAVTGRRVFVSERAGGAWRVYVR